jgi:hypothetical protein
MPSSDTPKITFRSAQTPLKSIASGADIAT